MYNLTFQQIYAFLTAARFSNLSKAAEYLLVSQPALSRTLGRFEETVGLKVFSRSNQGVKLLPAGKYLYSEMEPLYDAIETAIRNAQSIAEPAMAQLRIIQPIAYSVVDDYSAPKEFIKKFEDKYPNVQVEETLCDFQELRQRLEYGNADIVISQDFAIADITNISSRRVAPYNMFVAVSHLHPLARHDIILPEMLADETLHIVPKTGTPVDKTNALSLYNKMGFSPKSIEFAANFQTLLHTIRHRNGISICGRFKNASDIKYYPIPGALNHASVVVAWNTRRLTAAAQNFINMIPVEG